MTIDTKPPARIYMAEMKSSYVRADIVDALIDALEIAKEEIEFLGGITKSLDIARAALAQAKG